MAKSKPIHKWGNWKMGSQVEKPREPVSREAVVEEMTITQIVMAVGIHHVMNPDHGLDCACMDKYIRRARKLLQLDSKDLHAKLRVEHVLRKALEQ